MQTSNANEIFLRDRLRLVYKLLCENAHCPGKEADFELVSGDLFRWPKTSDSVAEEGTNVSEGTMVSVLLSGMEMVSA